MKLSEAKSIEKKIILITFCLILFLIFTATSYGTIDPKYDKLRGDPWDHVLSPPVPEDTTVQVEVSVFLIPFNFNAGMVFYINKNIGHSSSITHKKTWTNNSKNTLKR
jgi:hypothetical protein